ncbi:MAG: ribose 5-phosphate isomerase B [Bradymonadia bacterium]|jgi:ribose 5-phosphate isomerase B
MSHAVPKRVLVASDHAGVASKAFVAEFLRGEGFDVLDLGPQDTVSVDYPDFAHQLATRVVLDDVWGVLICGSGIGMSIAANKVSGARAALTAEPYSARMAREHNDANIIVVGARVIGTEMIKECLRVFSSTSFTPGDDGRHRRRVEKIEPATR